VLDNKETGTKKKDEISDLVATVSLIFALVLFNV
jgi:hypothetical protein